MTPQTFPEAFERVKQLVGIFRKNEAFYLGAGYSEADARKDFIDKFWIALGWDINHETQTNPYQQEVKVERGVTTNEWRKRADYAFLAPNFRDVRFFVEAKKPQANIDNPVYYFQTIRYGWNSHVPLSVLTDFEGLRVLDCRYKPDITTALGRAVLKYHYTDFADEQKFRTVYYLFSREAVLNGSLEDFAKGLPRISRKRAPRGVPRDGAQSIDEAFLTELDEYREELARAFKRKNPQLESEELTEITQRTLDRLVFMRFLEDKLILRTFTSVETPGEPSSRLRGVWIGFTTASSSKNTHCLTARILKLMKGHLTRSVRTFRIASLLTTSTRFPFTFSAAFMNAFSARSSLPPANVLVSKRSLKCERPAAFITPLNTSFATSWITLLGS